ncbi:MAG: M48 family metalloprotease [SAR324 cluster bacterium]|nr:M48 family metalloprotease [SAR324 cluster bacterium]
MIYQIRLDQDFQQILEKFSFRSELSLLILLLTYWLGDSLCMDRVSVWTKKELAQKFQKIVFHLRLQLPILILIFFQFSIFQVIDFYLSENFGWQKDLLIFSMSLLIMMVFSPFIMTHSWGAKPLSSKMKEKIIQTELKASQVSVTQILSWPEHIISTATAGVIGFIPGCRYLLISEQLIQLLSADELRAVIAHEAGHLKKYHLPFFLFGFIAFSTFISLSWYIADQYFWLFIWEKPLWIFIILTGLGIFIFIRFVFGFLSRNFERQADCNSLEKVGYDPFKQALLKVAWINGIDPESDNWHHYGIQQRLEFLAGCLLLPKRVQIHHQRVFKIKMICLALVVMMVGANTYALSDLARLKFSRFLLPQHLQSLELHKEKKPVLLGRMAELATRYLEKNQIDQAEPIYRKILEITPNNPLVLNNLSWLLATNYGEIPEKVEESIHLAQLALQKEKAAFIWDTLAEAYHKRGENSQALEAAEQALLLAEQGKGISIEAGIDYYQERSLIFRHLAKQAK